MSGLPRDAFVSKAADAAFAEHEKTFLGGYGGGRWTAYRAFMAGWKARKEAQYRAALGLKPKRSV